MNNSSSIVVRVYNSNSFQFSYEANFDSYEAAQDFAKQINANQNSIARVFAY